MRLVSSMLEGRKATPGTPGTPSTVLVIRRGSSCSPAPRDRAKLRDDGTWDRECNKPRCKQERRALAELRAKDEKFEASGRQQLLRGALRRVSAECSEALRKVEEELLLVREVARKQAHSRYRPLVAVAEEKCKKMAQVLALEKKARVAAEQRATAADELASKLAYQLGVEQLAYQEKAKDVVDAKKQKRQRSVEARTLMQERDDAAAAQLEQEQLAATATATAAFAEALVEVERARADAADAKKAAEIARLTEEMTGKLDEARAQTKAAREAVEAVVRKGPKAYTDEQLDTLSYDAEKQARYRERKFFRWLLGGRNWREYRRGDERDELDRAAHADE